MRVVHTEPISSAIAAIRAKAGLSQEALARFLGVSFVSINRWERGASVPSPAQTEKILRLKSELDSTGRLPERRESHVGVFASHGVRQRDRILPLFQDKPTVNLSASPGAPVISRIRRGSVFTEQETDSLTQLLARHREAGRTADSPLSGGVSAGKNSYTYDAHTYHTKVPPQGIAELIQHYLPEGGLMLDPFGGSGMTGVAAAVTGHDCILNELSPAACFIANRFLARVSSDAFGDAVRAILDATAGIREQLYVTTCRECGKPTELLYVVWSYRVVCNHCNSEFQLWSACRRYGSRVREHKILKEFDCPCCAERVIKSRLTRTVAEPVQVGYFCCGSRQQEVMHKPLDSDLALIASIDE